MTAADNKYGTITASGKQFHPGEPVFLLRATDPFARAAIREYAQICEENGCSAEHVARVRACVERMRGWQHENPELVKDIPD
jgi:hypothetical protein